MDEFTVQLYNIPFRVNVTHYAPPIEGFFSGAPEDCYPSEPAELEWEFAEDSGLCELAIVLIMTFDSLQENIQEQLLEILSE